ncbi:MAG TPA: hypothetical protein DER60_06880 [Syntrophomonas sp.]|nr:hypothetical protein [Syntrophomonas sp.]
MRAIRPILVVLILTLAAMLAVGCSPNNNPGDNQPNQNDPQAAEIDKEITLYFSDQQAQFLAAEKRTVKVASDQLQAVAEAVVNELIAGPKGAGLVKTIPPETKLLAVSIQDAMATVDFSKELKTKHWGGSTGESMTIMSIVNSLTELPGIEKVQILIEGQKEDTLAGHWDLSSPISRDESIIGKEIR